MRDWIRDLYIREMVVEKNDGPDFYYDENGRTVFTEAFLKKRGFCCRSGCKHCPYPQNFNEEMPQESPV